MFDHLRLEYFEPFKDMMRLQRKFPELRNFGKTFRKIREELLPYYNEYISGISSDEMAISLKLSVFLLIYCNIFKPKSILDLGSGFSSFVFRYFQKGAKIKPLIYSVDNNPVWLDKTYKFLKKYNLNIEELTIWDSFKSKGHNLFELILYDLDGWDLRLESLEYVLALSAPQGAIILDDLHKVPYGVYARRILDRHHLKRYSLKFFTKDHFGRYSMLVTH